MTIRKDIKQGDRKGSPYLIEVVNARHEWKI